jgi:hypothetical protein
MKKEKKPVPVIDPSPEPPIVNPGNNFGTGGAMTPGTNFGTNQSVSVGTPGPKTEIERNLERMKREAEEEK